MQRANTKLERGQKMFETVMSVTQLLFTVAAGLYFVSSLKSRYSDKSSVHKESTRELERLKKLNNIKLTVPLTEKTRPKSMGEIVGQEDGITALRAALCGENPQHVLIYGPPGVGKTAAARVVLEEAKSKAASPFTRDAKFIETDATTMQFDERNIADPLIGSVHDPIYQGAGAYGPAGVPQPKPGAVTRAHGGVLFIDEIGELQSIQMNRLLKVLEDRRVYFDSAYYSRDNKEIPRHIHEMFENGLPADFRLIGATTRSPEEIPPALRSRCTEIFFRPLSRPDIKKIAAEAAKKSGFDFDEKIFDLTCEYAQNGRDAVNIIQTAENVAKLEHRTKAELCDAQWVIETGKYSPRADRRLTASKRCGCISGLAVSGSLNGYIIDIEAVAEKVRDGRGSTILTGAVGEEEISSGARTLRRKSSISASAESALTVLKTMFGTETSDYDIHISFPPSIPSDGSSAGIAIFCAVYSAIHGIDVPERLCMTGEISVKGDIRAVGAVTEKIRAAVDAGASRIIIPASNMQDTFNKFPAEIIPVSRVSEIIDILTEDARANSLSGTNGNIISA